MSGSGEYLRWLRAQKGWGLRQGARELGISPSYLSQLEQDFDGQNPTTEILDLLAQAYGTTAQELLAHRSAEPISGATTERENPQDLLGKLAAVMSVAIPIIAEGSAGEQDGFVEYAHWGQHKVAKRNILGIRVTGDCLAPTIFPGDTVFVDKDLSPQNSNIILCLVDGRLLLKRYREKDGQRWIESRHGKIEFEQCEMFGVVIERNERLR